MDRIVLRFASPAIFLLTGFAVLSTQAETTRQDAPAESKWRRQLPSGVIVELLGMSDPQVKPVAWWTPEGKPLAMSVTKSSFGPPSSGQQSRNFALRVDGPNKDDFDVIWDFGKYYGAESGNAILNGDPVPGVDYAVVNLPSKATSWTIKLTVAAAGWVTDATRTSNGEVKLKEEGRSVIFSPPHAIERGTAVVVAEDFPGQRDVLVVAFDKAGKRRSASGTHGGWYSKAFRLHDATLMGIKPDEIGRIELQSRPYETIEFKDVPLAAPQR
jgi:hypothetical protein